MKVSAKLMHGMYFAKDNALNEQKHETLPVFAEIGNKHPQSRHLDHRTFTHPLKTDQVGLKWVFVYVRKVFCLGPRLHKRTRGRLLLLLIINIAPSKPG